MKKPYLNKKDKFEILKIKHEKTINKELGYSYNYIAVYFTIEPKDKWLFREMMDGWYSTYAVTDKKKYKEYYNALDFDIVDDKDSEYSELRQLKFHPTIKREDFYIEVWHNGGCPFIDYLERANVYVFNEYFQDSAGVHGILNDITKLQQDNNVSNIVDVNWFAALLEALSRFWH